MASVKYAISAYVADGTTTDYLITWDYLDEDHIAVYVDGTSNADPTASHTFSKLNDTTLRVTDELGNAIAAGAEIEIRRETPLTTRAITFADGSALLASDLNKNSDYLLYSMQEVLDTVDAAAQDGALAAQVATEGFRDEAEGFKNTTAGYLATVQSDATDADNHRIAAAASEAASAASEAAAATSESNAATSATNSANSATASANSASASAASAAASLASEQASAASETAAAASEAASAASEAASAASEAAAATSEANAAASFDDFDDRYLGAKASAPTVDNDGDALLTGALYWNSTNDTMYVWNGSSWDTLNSQTGIADGATSTRLTISDTAIQVDANAELLVGKTTTAFGDVGARISTTDNHFTADNGTVADFNRLTSDGAVLNFYKDSTNVGSVSVTSTGSTYKTGTTTSGSLHPEGLNLPRLASDPANAENGQIYYNTADSVIKYYNGVSWSIVSEDKKGQYSFNPFESWADINAAGAVLYEGQYWVKFSGMSSSVEVTISPNRAGDGGKNVILGLRGDTGQVPSYNNWGSLPIPFRRLIVQRTDESLSGWAVAQNNITWGTGTSSSGTSVSSAYTSNVKIILYDYAGGFGIYNTSQQSCNWSGAAGAIGAGYNGSTCNTYLWGTGPNVQYSNLSGNWSIWIGED